MKKDITATADAVGQHKTYRVAVIATTQIAFETTIDIDVPDELSDKEAEAYAVGKAEEFIDDPVTGSELLDDADSFLMKLKAPKKTVWYWSDSLTWCDDDRINLHIDDGSAECIDPSEASREQLSVPIVDWLTGKSLTQEPVVCSS